MKPMNAPICTSAQKCTHTEHIQTCLPGSTKIIGRRLSRENRAAFAKFQVRLSMYTQTNVRGPASQYRKYQNQSGMVRLNSLQCRGCKPASRVQGRRGGASSKAAGTRPPSLQETQIAIAFYFYPSLKI